MKCLPNQLEAMQFTINYHKYNEIDMETPPYPIIFNLILFFGFPLLILIAFIFTIIPFNPVFLFCHWMFL